LLEVSEVPAELPCFPFQELEDSHEIEL